MTFSAAASEADVRGSARHSVRHFLVDFPRLESEYPGAYPRMLVRGEGAYLWDDAGHRVLDAGGGHLGACQIGHGRREVAESIAAQARELEFAALDSGLSHPKAVEVAELLAPLLPLDEPVFSFTVSGSESNEVAFKIARAYHARRGEERRVLVLSRDGSYHGSTFAAMAATGAAVFSAGFGPAAPGFAHVAQPSPGRCGYCSADEGCTLRCADALEQTVAEVGAENVAAVVAEPVAILQAVKVPHPDYWARVQSICRDAGALLIVDEVVTGFGRTGRMFGCEHWDIRPDIVTLAKGMTSGYVPFGATAVSRQVEEPFRERPLMHLNTYAGHPVGCAAAIANVEILRRERLVENAAALEPVLRRELEAVAARVPRVLRVSAIGLLASVEVDASALPDVDASVRAVRYAMYENGAIARCAHSGGVLTVVFYPPLTVAEADVRFGVGAVGDALAAVLG